MAESSVKHVPAGDRWAFDESVTNVFEDMLQRSIPQYEVMRAAVQGIARRHRRDGLDVVDLGCSRGDAMEPLVQEFGTRNRFVGVEVSEPMLRICRARFRTMIEHGVVEVLPLDLRREYPGARACVTLCVLTLQFVPIEHRQRLVRRAFEHTAPGGALVLVEKVLGAGDLLDSMMVDAYYAMKGVNGYGAEEIERKRLSLEGVLVPVTAKWNEDLLRTAGFGHVDCFWRWMNFAGWVAVRE